MVGSTNRVAMSIKSLSVWYGSSRILNNITLDVGEHGITAIIGPSGCGKSTLIRCLNRMNDFIPKFKLEGEVIVDGRNIYDKAIDPIEIRLRIGMVFQKPNPFPKSIYENIVYGPRLYGVYKKVDLDSIVESTLKRAFLWEEVKDKLNKSALELSGGQQQRLCISRALAVDPGVLLLDEPCSALDPVATTKIEELMLELKNKYTLIIVTHNMQQAARVSDHTAFLYMGDLVEFGDTSKIFTNPSDRRTEQYITGRFG